MNIAKWIDDRLRPALRASGGMDGRLIVVAMVCAYFALLFVASQLRHRPYYQVWRVFGVPAISFSDRGLTTNSFGDLRSVLSCYECTRLGYDVMVNNPRNPNQIGKGATPYPRIWWTFSPAWLSQPHTVALGLFFTAIFYGAVLLFIGNRNVAEGVVFGLFLCSPALMLLVERCNVDNLLFLAMLAALYIGARGKQFGARLGAYILIFVAALFKIYPLAGLVVILKEEGRRRALLAGVFAALFVAYYLSHLAEMRLLRNVAGNEDKWSYGYKIIFLRVAKLFGDNSSHGLLHALKPFWGGLLVLTFVIALFVLATQLLAAFRSWLKQPVVTEVSEEQPDALNLDGFRIGAALYLLTFALGSVFSYKLVFLLLTLPQMLAWIKAGGAFSRVSSLGLVGLLIMLYLINFPAVSFDQIISWMLVGYFACGLAFTLPGKFKQTIHRVLSRKNN